MRTKQFLKYLAYSIAFLLAVYVVSSQVAIRQGWVRCFPKRVIECYDATIRDKTPHGFADLNVRYPLCFGKIIALYHGYSQSHKITEYDKDGTNRWKYVGCTSYGPIFQCNRCWATYDHNGKYIRY